MVFQNYALYPHMSVFENMAYGLKLRNIGEAEIKKRVDAAAQILELQNLLERRPRQLSGGQRQRVAMGRAIVREPAVFLFDEPLSNLDAKLRVQMRLEIKKLHQRLKTTSVYVTHDQVEAMTLGHRLIVMNAGVAEQIATPLEVYNKPATIFVAGFIGSPAMNLLPGSIGEDGRSVALEGGARLAIGLSAKPGRKVVFGIRPEDLGGGAAGQPVDLAVDLVEPLGADTLIHGRIGGAGADVTARLGGTIKAATGQRLPLALPPDKIHLFDAETGRRIEG
jgi:sn-glycerol 3-phosphate transport system ATP-binding protein